jgi:RNA polymerase sigma-70 factor (ECF subfamily)
LDVVQDSGDSIPFDPPDKSHDIPRERLMDVEKHVNRLPDEFRMPLMMLAVEGLTIPEIAEIMEMPEGTVKSRIFYARKRLKDALDRKKR